MARVCIHDDDRINIAFSSDRRASGDVAIVTKSFNNIDLVAKANMRD